MVLKFLIDFFLLNMDISKPSCNYSATQSNLFFPSDTS